MNCRIFVALLATIGEHLITADQTWTIPIEHTWSEDETSWTARGEVHLFNSFVDNTLIGRYSSTRAFTQSDKEAITQAAKNDGSYRVRCASNLDKAHLPIRPDDLTSYVTGHNQAKRLAQSNLQEVLLVGIDSDTRRLVSITPLPVIMNFDADYVSLVQELTAADFNTSIRIVDMMEGVAPDTQSYIQRIEQEKRQQQQAGGDDNRSFIAKYWMYIVPVVIFLLVSGAMGEGGS